MGVHDYWGFDGSTVVIVGWQSDEIVSVWVLFAVECNINDPAVKRIE